MKINIEGLSPYTRYPERIKMMDPSLSENEGPDVFGVNDRLDVISKYLSVRGGTAIDIGGNSGFYSLSLVDAGLLSSSVVYDTDVNALEAGRQMATMLGLSDKVKFVEKEITLENLKTVEPVDIVICLNLIHHSGKIFDIEEVAKLGWGEYSERWLSELKRISKVSILGLGFKSKKPVNWNVEKHKRPRIFKKMIIRQGWNVAYDANVQDIHIYGIEKANGIRSKQNMLYNNLSMYRKLIDRYRSYQ